MRRKSDDRDKSLPPRADVVPVRRSPSHDALFHSSYAIAEVTRRLQASLNLMPGPRAPSAEDEARHLFRARTEVRNRRAREGVFGKALFSEPAWEVLLELLIAHLEGRVVTVKSACVASRVPQTTALRYIAHLVANGLVQRRPHPLDMRSIHLELTDEGMARMADYFTRIASDPAEPEA